MSAGLRRALGGEVLTVRKEEGSFGEVRGSVPFAIDREPLEALSQQESDSNVLYHWPLSLRLVLLGLGLVLLGQQVQLQNALNIYRPPRRFYYLAVKNCQIAFRSPSILHYVTYSTPLL